MTPGASYEIWATGLRNPWRFAFDPATGDLLIPDVSRFHWDEINFWPASGGSSANFGWPLAEGNEYKIATTDVMPHAIGTRFDGEILVADSRAGAVWRLLFPALDDGEWVPVDRAMSAMVLEARRDGFDRSKEDLERVLASRTWR